MSPPPLVALANVGCTYYIRSSRLRLRRFEALSGLDLSIHDGEILGVIGQNGAGKSTLLRILSRILLPSAGSIRFRSGITTALLTLRLGFCPDLTGRENAVLGALYMGYTRREAEARMGKIIAFAELGDWIHEPIRSYSTGMLSRLGFAVAIEMEPDILLVDETLGVGDAYFREKSSKALRQKLNGGQTTVLVSHEPETIRRLCTRAVWLDKGRIRAVGDIEAVLGDYYASVLSEKDCRLHQAMEPDAAETCGSGPRWPTP